MAKKGSETYFQHFDGAKTVTVHFKHDVLWWQVLVLECICFSPEKKRVGICISGWSCMLQPYIESAT